MKAFKKKRVRRLEYVQQVCKRVGIHRNTKTKQYLTKRELQQICSFLEVIESTLTTRAKSLENVEANRDRNEQPDT